MRCVENGFVPRSYWISTGTDLPVRRLLRESDPFRNELSELMSGSSLSRQLNDSISTGRLGIADADDLHTPLVLTGCLRAVPIDGRGYDISVPNGEVMEALDRMVTEEACLDPTRFSDFCRAVLDGEPATVEEVLGMILRGSSYMDLGEFPHEVMLMTIMRGIVGHYETEIERESGNGRADVIMRPRNGSDPVIIFELKVSRTEGSLDSDARDAVGQIHDRRYYLGMNGRVLLYGISFWGKVPRVVMETMDLQTP